MLPIPLSSTSGKNSSSSERPSSRSRSSLDCLVYDSWGSLATIAADADGFDVTAANGLLSCNALHSHDSLLPVVLPGLSDRGVTFGGQKPIEVS